MRLIHAEWEWNQPGYRMRQPTKMLDHLIVFITEF